jgi:ATP-binding cassette subfamily B protein
MLTQESLRSAISLVPQEPLLFHRSLGENIAYGRPGVSRDEIVKAAIKAHAHDFIMALPDGYDTLVGERGVKLSGGERQRVALARAVLADARILIFDEATSSLDSISEALMQQALEDVIEDRTTIIVAHRLSTVQKVDRILVFDRGRIVEQGTHAELLARPNGHYQGLFRSQALGLVGEIGVAAE